MDVEGPFRAQLSVNVYLDNVWSGTIEADVREERYVIGVTIVFDGKL